MHRSIKKIISILCVLALLLGMVPSAAFAAPYAAQAERASEPASGAVNGNSGEPAADRSGGFSPKTSEVVDEHSAAWQALQAAIDGAADGATIKLTEDAIAGSSDGPLMIPDKQLTIDLNGYKIDRNLTDPVDYGYVIYASGHFNHTVTFTGTGTITGGRNTGNGGGIYVDGINLALKDSVSVTGNTAAKGGGIYIGGECTLYLYNSSSVTGNTAAKGGGVYIDGCFFDIHDSSSITENTATGGGDGGGVYAYAGELRLYGGSISDNNSDARSKGIYQTGGSNSTLLTLPNGSTAKVADSVYLPTGCSITVQGTPSAEACIHVTTQTTPTPDASVAIADSEVDCTSSFVVDNQPHTRLVWKSNEIRVEYRSTVMTWAELQEELDAGGMEETAGEYDICLGDYIAPEDGDTALVFNYTDHPVTLDLNGYEINRGLSTSTENGNVLTVLGGTLTIRDSSTEKTGKIKGGHNEREGGGVRVLGGTLTMEGGSITSNYAASGGGGVYVYRGSFNMEGGSVENNMAKTYGGGIYVIEGSANIKGGVISGNRYGDTNLHGGGIFVGGEGSLTIEDSEIKDHQALYGGGVYVAAGGSATMTSGSISGNTATSDGGGIYVAPDGSATINGGSIQSNTAMNNGGGILIESGSLDLKGGTISGNTATQKGKGIYQDGSLTLSEGAELYVTDSVYLSADKFITVNSIPTEPVHVQLESTATLTNPVVIARSTTDCCDIFVIDSKQPNTELFYDGTDHAVKLRLTPVVTTWAELQASLDNGGVPETTGEETVNMIRLGGDITAADNESALVFNYTDHPVTLDLNGYTLNRGLYYATATANGNVLTIKSGNLTIRDSRGNGQITGGSNTGNGGGIVVEHGSLTLESGKIYHNINQNNIEGLGHGGGIYVDKGCSFIMKGGVIEDGHAGGHGGGVYIDGGSFTMSGGKITLCVSGDQYGGGGVYVNGGSFTMSGGSLDTNIATYGSGVFLNGGSFTIQDGTLTGNTVGDKPDGNGCVVYAQNNASIQLSGGTIQDNKDWSPNLYRSFIYFDDTSSLTLTENSGPTVTDGIKLADGQFIKITGPLATWAKINIVAAGTPTFGQPVKIAESAQDCREYLVIENQPENTELVWENGEILLRDKSDITTWAELQQALNNGGTWVDEEEEGYYIIRLSNDVTATGTDSALTFSYVEHDVTLDLNGHTINRNLSAAAAADNGNVLTVESGTLILSDSEGGGSITGGNNTASGGGVVVNGGKLFADVGITGNKSQDDGGGVHVNGGSFTLEGGSVTGNTAKYDGGGIDVDSGSVTLLSGNINNNTARDNSKGINLSSNGALTLSGSSASIVTDNIYLPRNKTITVNGSPAAGSEIHVWSQDMPLIGDPVTIAVAAQEWTEYFAVSNKPENAELIWTENKIILQTKPEVTSWGDLQKALTAGGTLERQGTEDYYIVRLANDVAPGDNESALEFNYTGHDVILDLNGHTIDRKLQDQSAGHDSVLNVQGGNLILRDSGNGGKITGGFAVSNGVVNIREGATFTMEGGSITGNQAAAYGGIYVDNGGALNLKGGNISGNTTYSTQTRGRGIYVNSNAVLTLFNGSAITVTDSVYLPGGNIIRVSSTPADGSDILVAMDRDPTIGNPVIIANSETDCAANFRVENQPANTSIIWENGQVKLITEGVKGWAALQAALNAGGTETPDGFIIQLGGDVGAESDDKCLTFDYGNHPVILDLNGHTINRNLSAAAAADNGNVLTVYSGELTLRDSKGGGQITGGNNSSYGAGGVNLYGGIFTMEGGSITGNAKQGSNGGGVYMDSGTFNLKGGSITGNSTSETLGGGVYVNGGTFTVSGSPTVTGNGNSNIYLAKNYNISLGGELTKGASLGIGAGYEGTFAPDAQYEGVVETGFFTADRGYRLYKDSAGHPAIESENHNPSNPTWEWAKDFSAATLSVVCKNCGDLIWSETGTVTIAYDAQAGKLQAVATATHDEQTYTETKDLSEYLIRHEAKEPAIDEDGTYTSGTQAYYELTAGDKKYYYTEVDGHPGEPCDPSTLKLDNFVISATSQNNGIIEKYIGSFGTEKTGIDLPSQIVNTVDQTTQYVPLKMLGNSVDVFYTLPEPTETPAPSPSPVEITDRGSITNVSAGAFTGLSNLTLTLNAEEPITIANGAFTGCDNVTIRVMDVSGLKEGLHDDATGKYTVELIDGHHYEVTATTWAEDYSTAEITITCSTCGEEHKLPAQVTKTETATEDPETHEKTYTLSIKAEGTFEEQTYTVELENVPFFNVTVESMTGTLRLPCARNADNTDYENYAVFYVKQDMLDPLNPPAGAALAGLTDGSGNVYNADERVQITSDTNFTAKWRSTWARVQTALNAGGTVAVTLYSDITPAEGDGYLHIPQGVTATLDLGGHTINRGLGAATADGYVIRVDGDLILNNGTVTGGNNTDDGGGIYVGNGGTLETNNVSITHNQAQNGGGVYMLNVSGAEFNNSSITDNTAAQQGGGLYIGGEASQLNGGILGSAPVAEMAVILNSTVVARNTAGMSAGGVYVNRGDMKIGSKAEIIDNKNLEGDKFDNIGVEDGAISILKGATDFVLGLPSLAAGGIAGLPIWVKGLLGLAAGVTCLLIFDTISKEVSQKKSCEHPSKNGEVEWEEETYSSASETVWCGKCNAYLGTYSLTVNKEVYSGTQVTHYWVEPQYARTNTTRDVQPFKLIKQANIPAGIDTTETAADLKDQEKLIAHDRKKPHKETLNESPWEFADGDKLKFEDWLHNGSVVKEVTFSGDKDDEEITVKVNWKLPYGYKANDSEDAPVSGDHPLKPDERTNPDYVDSGKEEKVKENKWTRSNYEFTTWKMPSSVKLEKEGTKFKLVYSYDDGTEQKKDDKITIDKPTMLQAEWQSKWAKLAADLEKDPHSVEMSENVEALSDDKTITVAEDNTDTLDLKGKTLDGKSQSGVKHIFDISGTLTVKDSTDEKNGVVKGGKTDKNGAGALVEKTGTLKLESGSIKDNMTVHQDNSDPGHGGGVYVDGDSDHHGSFEMSGGSVKDNKAWHSGGGVYIKEHGSFKMSGGEITGNKAGHAESGSGSSDAKGGGVYVGGSFEISGKVIIKDNKIGEEANNVYLPKDKTITVSGKLDDDAEIHVRMEEPGVITKGLNANGGEAARGKAKNFVSDDDDYMVVINKEGEAELVIGPVFDQADLELGGILRLRFKMAYPNGWEHTDNERMEFRINGREEPLTISYRDAPTDKDGKKYFACPVNAYQMADLIQANYFYSNAHTGDEELVYEAYSVKEYLDYLLEHESEQDEKTLALVQATKNYGHYIQPYLADTNHWTVGVDYAEMDAYGPVTPAENPKEKYGEYSVSFQKESAYSDLVSKSQFYLTLDSDTILNVRVYLRDKNGSVTGTANGQSVEPWERTGNSWVLSLRNLPATALEQQYSFTCSVNDQPVFTMSAAPLSFVNYALADGGSSEAEKLALTALYEYAMAANAYAAGS